MSEQEAKEEAKVDAKADANVSSFSKLPPAENRIGTSVDKYTIVRLLGRGGMGAVYEARHAKLARRFAIKFLLAEFAANRDVLRRFENEAKAAGGLEHPNLAAVMDVGQATDGAPYLVMEFLEGQDASRLLRSYGPLPARRAVDIVQQACRGLAVAHRAGIVHRDLKPANLFIADAGDGSDHVKVLDFGIAKLRSTDASVATGTGATFGTAFYMSPEQARGAGEVDHRADVWSLGVLLYELLSGQMPFQGGAFLEVIHKILSTEPRPLNEARPGLPPGLVALVHQTLRKELLERPPSVVALAEALAPFAEGASSSRPSTLDGTRPAAETQASSLTGVGLGAGSGAARDFTSPPGGTGRAGQGAGGHRVTGGSQGTGGASGVRGASGVSSSLRGTFNPSEAPGFSGSVGPSGSSRSHVPAQSAAPASGRGRAVLGLVVGIALVALGAFFAFGLASKLPASGRAARPETAPAPAPAAIAPPSGASPEAVSPPPHVAGEAPAPSPGLPSGQPPPSSEPSSHPSGPGLSGARPVSEQFERRLNRGANTHRAARDLAVEGKQGAASSASSVPSASPGPAPAPSPPAQQATPPPSGHPIEIERDNPYGNSN